MLDPQQELLDLIAPGVGGHQRKWGLPAEAYLAPTEPSDAAFAILQHLPCQGYNSRPCKNPTMQTTQWFAVEIAGVKLTGRSQF